MKNLLRTFLFSVGPLVILLAASPATAGPLSQEASCLLKTSLAGVKVAKIQNAQSIRCLLDRTKYDASEGDGLTAQEADDCLLGGPSSRVPKARSRVASIAATKCSPNPSFGFSTADNIGRAAAEQSLGLAQDLFGNNVGNAVVPKANDLKLAGCQIAAAKGTNKIFAKQLQQFSNCFKAGLKSNSIIDAASLNSCLDDVASDPQGKIAKSISGLSKTLARKCNLPGIHTPLPGACAGAGTQAACLGERTACRACLQIADAHDLSMRDCDLFDDGAANQSCIACNGAASLCDRRFDALVYPTSHNTMSNAIDGWLAPNNATTIPTQLASGIRSLMLDAWYWGGDAVLCHGGEIVPGLGCDITGQKALDIGLSELKTYLDNHPHEVLSIILESYISEADMLADFTSSGLIDHVYAHNDADPWPTLRELISAGTRLVVFTDDSSASLDWYHYVWSHAWETHYSFTTPESFSCDPNRGSTDNPLHILNHFLTAPFASVALASSVNFNPLFRDRVLTCQNASGALPNFVTVDFENIGDVYKVVRELNRLPEL
jgi:hypothetical protein